jgi:hypothetical protein
MHKESGELYPILVIFMNNILLRFFIAFTSMLMCMLAHAETIQVTGQLTISQITIKENLPTGVTAYSLNPISISLANETPQLCTLGGTKQTYNSPSLDCVLTWKNYPPTLTATGATLSGKFTSPVTTTIEYEVAIMVDGLSDRRVIKSGLISLNVLPPSQPVISKASVNTYSSAFIDLGENTVFTTQTYTYPKLGVTVEPRGYDQRITLAYPGTYLNTAFSYCDVLAGQTSCNANFTPTLNDVYGREPFSFTVACSGTCTGIESYTKTLSTNFEWDYRPPINTSLVATIRQGASTPALTPVVNNLRNGETFTITLAGVSGGTASLVNGNTAISFQQSGGSSTASVSYKVLTSQGRQATGSMIVTVLVDRSLDDIMMPLLASGFEMPFPYTSVRSVALPDNSKLEGNIPVKLSLPPSAQLGVKINGITVSPGASVNTSITFSQGVPQIGMEPAARQIGTETLTIEPTSTMYPLVKVKYITYEIVSSLKSPTNVAAGFEQYKGSVETNCPIRTQDVASTNSAYCYVDWTLPSGVEPDPTHPEMVTGYVSTGNYTVSYQLKAIYSGTPVTISTGSGTFTTTEPDFDFGLTNLPIYRVLGNQRHSLISLKKETDPLTCTFYGGEMVPTTQLSLDRKRLYCHVEWVKLPAGYDVFRPSTPNILDGEIADIADNQFHLVIKTMLPNRTVVTVEDKVITAEVINPTPPVLTIQPYMSTTDGDYLYYHGHRQIIVRGKITSDAGVMIKVYKGETLVGQMQPYSTGRLDYIPSPQDGSVGTKSRLRIHTYYTSAPEVNNDTFIDAIPMPSNYVRPVAVLSQQYTDDLNSQIDVAIQDSDWRCLYGLRDCEYSAQAYGRWSVFVSSYAYKTEQINRLTPSVPVDSEGHASFSMALPAQTHRYTIVGELLDENGNVLTTRISTGFNVVVLKKTAIEGTAITKRISGRAPLSTLLQYVPDNLEDQRNIKKVTWESNDGTGWKVLNNPASIKSDISIGYVFQVGTHRVRAQVSNKFDVLSVTDEIQVEAYHVPKLTIEGQTQALPGQTVEMNLMMDGKPIDLDKYFITWDINGESYVDVPSYTLASPDTKSINVRVQAHLRHLIDDVSAFAIATKTVSYQWPRYIYVDLDVPKTVMDDGKPVIFTAKLGKLPFTGTLEGQWMLPDGSVHEGTSVSYTPEPGVNGQKTVKFFGWLAEYPSAKANVMKYITLQSTRLPEMSLVAENEGPYKAPIKIPLHLDVGNSLSVSQINYLQMDPSVNQGTLAMGYGGTMTLTTAKGGNHDIALQVTNQYGVSKPVLLTIPVEHPDPYTLSLTPRTDLSTFKAPGIVYFDVVSNGLSSNDAVVKQTLDVNGNTYYASVYRNLLNINFSSAGTYDITLKYVTKLGMETTATVKLNIQ